MNGSIDSKDERPLFMCLQSGHKGPFVPPSIYSRGVACKKCFAKMFPSIKTGGEPIADQMAQQMRRQQGKYKYSECTERRCE